MHLSQPACMNEVDRVPNASSRAPLGAGRTDASISPGRRHDPGTLVDHVRDRLLDVDVLACIQRPTGQHRVGVIRGRDRDGVDVIPLQERSDISGRLDREAGSILRARGAFSSPPSEHFRIDVAERDHLATWLRLQPLNVIPTSASNPDHRHAKGPGAIPFSRGLGRRPARRRFRRIGVHRQD